MKLVCTKVEDSAKDCEGFVETYFEKIYAKDLEDLSPEFCKELGACTSMLDELTDQNAGEDSKCVQ